MRDGHILLQEDKHILLTDYGIIETDETSPLDLPQEVIIASRIRQGQRQTLVNNVSTLHKHARFKILMMLQN